MNKKIASKAIFLLPLFATARRPRQPSAAANFSFLFLYNKTMWAIYILRCRGGRLYTGVTNNLPVRIAAHNNGTGGAFTRAMRPCTLVWHEHRPNRSEAQRREYEIKKMPRPEKDALTVDKNACEHCPI